MASSSSSSNETVIRTFSVQHNWLIENFCSLKPNANNEFIPCDFEEHNTTFRIKVYPFGLTGNAKDLNILVNVSLPTVEMQSKCSIRNMTAMVSDGNGGDRRAMVNYRAKFVGGGDAFLQVKPFMKVLNRICIPTVVGPGGKALALHVFVTIQFPDTVTPVMYNIKKALAVAMYNDEIQLAEDVGKMFLNQVGSDLTVEIYNKDRVLVDSFPAHKPFLAAGNTYFSALFSDNGYLEDGGVLKIEDIDPCIMRGVVEYLYTRRCKCLWQYPADILAAAGRFMVKGLFEKAERGLIAMLDLENCLQQFEFADSHNAEELKFHCIQMIKPNFAYLKSSKDYEDIVKPKPELLQALCE